MTGKKLLPSLIWPEWLFRKISRDDSPHIEDAQLEDKSVKIRTASFAFNLSCHQESFLGITNLGDSFTLKAPAWIAPLLITGKDEQGWTLLSLTGSFKRTYLFEEKRAVGFDRFAFELSTPWLDATRSFSQTFGGLQVEETAKIKTSRISAADVKGSVFQEMVSILKTHYKNAALVFQTEKY